MCVLLLLLLLLRLDGAFGRCVWTVRGPWEDRGRTVGGPWEDRGRTVGGPEGTGGLMDGWMAPRGIELTDLYY